MTLTMQPSAADGSSLGGRGPWASAGSRSISLSNPFPLEILPERGTLRNVSSRTRQKFDRSRRVDSDINEALRALNWYAGSKEPVVPRCDSSSHFSQPELHARIRESVLEQASGAAIPGQQAAFKELPAWSVRLQCRRHRWHQLGVLLQSAEGVSAG